MSDGIKWGLKKVDQKNYGVYTFLLIVIGDLTAKVSGILGVFGRILMVVGFYYFFMWIWYKFTKQKGGNDK